MKLVDGNSLVTKKGNSPGDRNEFRAVFVSLPTYDDISQEQTSLGYPPQGYGGPWDITIKQISVNNFITRWKSSASCD